MCSSDLHKMSLRASVTSELVFDNVRLPASAVLPGVQSLRGPLSCLSEARYGIIWGVVGAARDCIETAIDYTMTRRQFNRPLAGFQLTQQKLAAQTGYWPLFRFNPALKADGKNPFILDSKPPSLPVEKYM